MKSILNKSGVKTFIKTKREEMKSFWDCKQIDSAVYPYYERALFQQLLAVIKNPMIVKKPSENYVKLVNVAQLKKSLLMETERHWKWLKVQIRGVEVYQYLADWLAQKIMKRIRNHQTGCGKTFRIN